MRELIHGLNVIQLISALCQLLQIPCQSGGVTADVDNALGSNFQHGLNADLIAALAGRVNTDDIDLRIFSLRFQVFHVIREDFFSFADVEGWAQISEEQVLERNPDYILTITMYYGEGPTPEEEIMGRAGWENVTAVKNGDILNLVDDELSRPGPRLVEGAQMLFDFVVESLAAQELAPAA